MPTNILRNANPKPVPARKPPRRGPRIVLITAGKVLLRAKLLDTETAERIFRALPLFSTAETWGECIHFETPIETGRERAARLNGVLGEICFWSSEDRVIIPFGHTPISRPGEMRLPAPCNPWAIAIDDVTAFKTVRPGEKAEVREA